MGISRTTPEGDPTAARRAPEALADALFTSTQQHLLGLLFGQSGRSFFVTELIELANVGRGAVQRELSRLERSGLLTVEWRGNQKHYRANPQAPIYKELRSIIDKTIGLQEQVRATLSPLEEKMSLAFIYGSIAKQTDTAKSDIDVLVVSDELTLEELYAGFAATEAQLGRKISPTLYTAPEFKKRRESGNPFLKRVLNGPITVLTGELDAA